MNESLIHKKICGEASCDTIYTPNPESDRCPKCGSEGIWLAKTLVTSFNPITKGVTWKTKKESGLENGQKA